MEHRYHAGTGASLLVVLFLTTGFCAPAYSETIMVPYDKATINEAVSVAVDGDTVLVAPGTYTENIDYLGKTITIAGSGGAGITFLRAENPDIPVVNITNGESDGTEFSGFTVTGGGNGHTVLVSGSSWAHIQGNVFYSNIPFDIFDKAVIACAGDSGYIKITRNIFYDNGGMSCVWILSGKVEVGNNTFDGNYSAIISSIDLTEARNNIATNSSGVAVNGAFAVLDYNDVWNNSTDYG
jgi:hypothetical protein